MIFEEWWKTQFFNENLKHLFKMGWDAAKEDDKNKAKEDKHVQ